MEVLLVRLSCVEKVVSEDCSVFKGWVRNHHDVGERIKVFPWKKREEKERERERERERRTV